MTFASLWVSAIIGYPCPRAWTLFSIMHLIFCWHSYHCMSRVYVTMIYLSSKNAFNLLYACCGLYTFSIEVRIGCNFLNFTITKTEIEVTCLNWNDMSELKLSNACNIPPLQPILDISAQEESYLLIASLLHFHVALLKTSIDEDTVFYLKIWR